MAVSTNSVRAVFQKLDRDLSRLASKPEAREVHRLRTGTRRLQILLSEFTPEAGRSQKKLLKQLNRLRKRAGKVRDLDVQMTALRSLKIPREPRRKTQLMNELIELRGRQEKKLRKVADPETIREIRRRLKRARKAFHPDGSINPLSVAQKMLQRVSQPEGPLTEDMLHRIRIVTKRARYAAEFANNSAEKAQFIARLKRLQDASGDWHDWLSLTRTASDRLGEMRESPLVAELHNVTGAKFRHAVAMLSQMHSKNSLDRAQPAQSLSRASATAVLESAAAA